MSVPSSSIDPVLSARDQYEQSSSKDLKKKQCVSKLLPIICAAVWSLFSSGIIFGFAALKPVLIDQGVYSELCDPNYDFSKGACTAQYLQLNNIFAVAAAVTNAMALPVGYTLDHYGPGVSILSGASFIAVAALNFVYAERVENFDGYFIGYTLLAIGGPFLFISTFHLANLFPKYSGSILALITGTFDSSSALFLVYKVIYFNVLPSLSVSRFFTLYLIVPCFIVFCQWTIMPWKAVKNIGTTQKIALEGVDEYGIVLSNSDVTITSGEHTPLVTHSHHNSTLRSKNQVPYSSTENSSGTVSKHRKSVIEQQIESQLQHRSGGAFLVMHNRPLVEQLRSPWFYLMVPLAAVLMLRINYFVATVYAQEKFLLDGDTDLASHFNSIFDIALPLGGVVAIPIIGLILDHTTSLTALLILFSVSIVVSILGMIHSYTANMIGMFLLVIYRPFYYTLVSDYTRKVFGFRNFGIVYGLLTFVCGATTVFQTYLDFLTQKKFNGNSNPVNLILLVLTLISGLALVLFVRARLSKLNHSQR